ncbi:MAG: glucose-1-phosphate adenylyltransferase subunit GlgD [Bacilli bacterium]|nr:glucose-1-phosphate adenylyltransferase subunit GlgD [Bacilli bacterium]
MANKVIGFLNLFDSPNLGALTEKRTLASTSFLGRFAFMDFALSNFTNSGIDSINVLVKDNFRSVSKHVGNMKTWVNNTKIAMQNILVNEKGIRSPKDNTDLECLLQNDWVLYEAKADVVVIQPAHIISPIDFRPILEEHFESDADVTVVYKHIENADESFRLNNVLKVKDGKVMSVKKNSGASKEADVSLETYIIGVNTLQMILHSSELLKLKSLKKAVAKLVQEKSARVHAYEHKGFARCFDSLQHFVDYSFELLDYEVAKDLFLNDWPIYTVTHNTPPTLYGPSAKVKNSFVANGAVVEGKVKNSIISRYVTIGKGAVIEDSVILTGTYIDAGAVVKNAVVDKYSHVVKKATIEGKKTSPVYVEQGTLVK